MQLDWQDSILSTVAPLFLYVIVDIRLFPFFSFSNTAIRFFMSTNSETLSGRACHDIRDDKPSSVVGYIDDFRDLPDAWRLVVMSLSSDSQSVLDVRHGREGIQLRVHPSGVGKNWSLAVCPSGIGNFEIRAHHMLDVTKRQAMTNSFGTLQPVLAISMRPIGPSLLNYVVTFSLPYDLVYVIANWAY